MEMPTHDAMSQMMPLDITFLYDVEASIPSAKRGRKRRVLPIASSFAALAPFIIYASA